MPRAEMPILLAGGVSVGAGIAREGAWPKNGTVAVIGTLALAVVASMFHTSKAAPIITGLAWLFLVAVLIKAIPAFGTSKAPSKKKAK